METETETEIENNSSTSWIRLVLLGYKLRYILSMYVVGAQRERERERDN